MPKALSIWQGWQTRRHNRLSVRPRLTSETNDDAGNGFYSIELINNGIGPALIEEFLVKVDGKVIPGQGVEPIKEVLEILFPKQHFKYNSRNGYIAKGHSMAAKDKISIVAIQFLQQPLPTLEFIEHASNKVSLDIHYKSFYGEQFHFHFPTQDEKSNKQIQPTN